MTRFRHSAVFIIALTACTTSETLTAPDAGQPVVREARVVSSTSYAPTDLGSLPGDEESIAWAVDDAGSVAVQSVDFPSTGGRVGRWYIQTGSNRTQLLNASIYALSGGATTYVAGFGDGNGQRWTYAPSSGFSASTVLPGSPRSLNDLGDAGGESASDGPVIMKLDGTTISIGNPDPAAYTVAETRGINNSGDVVVSYFDSYIPTPDRGYLRTSDGVMIELSPLAGHNSTYVRGLSEQIAGKIYVAGISDDDNGHYNAIRWTVDVVTHSITAIEVGPSGSTSAAMSNDGMIVGSTGGSSSSAFAWKRGESLVVLKTPKGLSTGRPWSVSSNGRYIAGDGMKGTYHRAVLWTAQ